MNWLTTLPPGLIAVEIHTPEDFADSLAGDLELAPIEPDDFTAKLMRAGFAVQPSVRSAAREESKQ